MQKQFGKRKVYFVSEIESDIHQQKKDRSFKTVILANEQMIMTQKNLIKSISNQMYEQLDKNNKLKKSLQEIDHKIQNRNEKEKQLITQFLALSHRFREITNKLLCTELIDQNNQNEIELLKKQLKIYIKRKSHKQSYEQEGIGRKLSKSAIFKLIEGQLHQITLVISTPEEIQIIDEKLWKKEIEKYQLEQGQNPQKFIEAMKNTIKKKFIPQKYRQIVWPLLIQNKLFIRKQFFNQLIQNRFLVPQKVLNNIKRDLDRTFTENDFVLDIDEFRENIIQILLMFHLYRPDISYVQGMMYPLILLLLNLNKFDAFKCFCNIMISNQFINSLFVFKIKQITLYCRTFDKLLQKVDKKLSAYLNSLKVYSENYIIEWFYTFFRKFSLKNIYKIWDLFLLYSYLVFYKISILIIVQLKSLIITSDFSTCLDIIKNFNKYIKQDQLLKKLISFNLSQTTVDQIMSKIQIQ